MGAGFVVACIYSLFVVADVSPEVTIWYHSKTQVPLTDTRAVFNTVGDVLLNSSTSVLADAIANDAVQATLGRDASTVFSILGDAVKQLRLLQQLKVDPEDQVCEPPTTLTTTTNPPRSESDGVQPFPRR